MKHVYVLIIFIAVSAAIHAHAQDLTFDIPEPTTAVLEKKSLWATYYHVWHATEAPSGVALLDENNKRISCTISQYDWCRGAIEGTILITTADGRVQTYNCQDVRRNSYIQPIPQFVKSSAQHTFAAFIVRDVGIVDQLTALHQ